MTTRRRQYRVGEKLQTIVAQELQRVGDPRFSMVTISSVVMSPDLRYASVYWVASGGEGRIPEVEEAFEGAQGRIRRVVAKSLGTRFVPELRFFYDNTLDTVDHIERLLNTVKNDSTDNR